MRRHLIIWAALLALLSPANAADSTVTALTAASALGGTELLYCVQGGADRKCTPAQQSTYTNSLFSQDCTVTSGGVVTCTKTNNVAFATSATTDTTNATNIASGTLAAARGGAGAITGALKGNGAGVVSQAACADLSNGATGCSTTVGTAATAATGTSGATLPFLNGTNTFSGTQTFGSVFGTVSTQSGTTYTLAATDCGTQIAFTNAAAVTVTIPAALTTGCNIAILQTTAAGQVTVTGTAVAAATLHSGHSYTKTFGQWSIIGINIYTTGVAILTGDGA